VRSSGVRGGPSLCSTGKFGPASIAPSLTFYYSAISAGTEGLAVAASAPGSDCLLPCGDFEWDQGSIGTNEPLLAASFSAGTSLGPFARTCQAAHILDKVLVHVNAHRHDRGQDVAEVLVEAMQLHNALLAFDTSLNLPGMLSTHSHPNPETPIPGQGVQDGRNQYAMALCSSARFLLYNEYSCDEFHGRPPGRERVAMESEVRGVAMRGIELLATVTVPEMARAVVQTSTAAATRPAINPLLGHVMYYAAAECACVIKESTGGKMHAALTQLVQGLEAMRTEWRVGGTCCRLLACSVRCQPGLTLNSGVSIVAGKGRGLEINSKPRRGIDSLVQNAKGRFESLLQSTFKISYMRSSKIGCGKGAHRVSPDRLVLDGTTKKTRVMKGVHRLFNPVKLKPRVRSGGTGVQVRGMSSGV